MPGAGGSLRGLHLPLLKPPWHLISGVSLLGSVPPAPEEHPRRRRGLARAGVRVRLQWLPNARFTREMASTTTGSNSSIGGVAAIPDCASTAITSEVRTKTTSPTSDRLTPPPVVWNVRRK